MDITLRERLEDPRILLREPCDRDSRARLVLTHLELFEAISEERPIAHCRIERPSVYFDEVAKYLGQPFALIRTGGLKCCMQGLVRQKT